MAIHVSRVTRIEDRYFVSYAFVTASGVPCLCESGASFVLQRRNDEWTVVGGNRWIS